MELAEGKRLLRANLSREQLYYRTAGLVLLCDALALLVMRIIIGLVVLPNDSYGWELVYDALFSVPVQIVFLLVVPFFIYKYRLKLTTREIITFSNFRKPRLHVMLLCIPLFITLYFFTMGVSVVSRSFLITIGCKLPSPYVPLPEKFNVGYFIASIFLTGVLPGFCEEFTNRGGFLSVMRNSFSTVAVIFISALSFGLFHQYILQFFYTMVFGGVAAYLVIRYKSIWPAILVHFLNNSFSVYLEYAESYGWSFGDYFETIMWLNNNGLLMVFFALMGALSAGILVIMHIFDKTRTARQKLETIKDSGFDHTHNRVVLFGQEDVERVKDLDMIKEVYGDTYRPEQRFKPSLRDNAFFIGAIVAAGLTTVFTFIWGYFY